MDKQIKTTELFGHFPTYLENLFSSHAYPWELLPLIGAAIKDIAHSYGFTEISDGIWVGENVKISKSATLIAPLLIGDACEIRPSAYLRGNVITGRECVIGNSSEVKNSILLDGVQIPHYNYVGDSILGNLSHLGAGAICSNLKSDKKSVVIKADKDYPTKLRKVGAFIGDGADIGCGCVLNPGTVIGQHTSVYPLIALRGVYAPYLIVKSATESVKRT